MIQIASPSRESFEEFRTRVKPLIRPDGTLARLRLAMKVDARFHAEFGVLRAYMRPVLERWPDRLTGFLQGFDETKDRLDAEAQKHLRALARRHSVSLARGRFDADYLDTLEELALFFVYWDVKSIFLAGAYQAITTEAIDIVLERAKKRGAIRVPQLIQILISALSLELNQIQRVYIMYERSRFEDLALMVKLERPDAPVGEENLPEAGIDIAPEDAAKAAETCGALSRQADLLAPAFFKALFELEPGARAALPEQDIAAGHAAFAALFGAVAATIGEPHALAARLRAFAGERPGLARSAGWRTAARTAMVAVFERACGLHWTKAHAEAWERVFDAGAALALEAAEGAQARRL